MCLSLDFWLTKCWNICSRAFGSLLPDRRYADHRIFDLPVPLVRLFGWPKVHENARTVPPEEHNPILQCVPVNCLLCPCRPDVDDGIRPSLHFQVRKVQLFNRSPENRSCRWRMDVHVSAYLWIHRDGVLHFAKKAEASVVPAYLPSYQHRHSHVDLD